MIIWNKDTYIPDPYLMLRDDVEKAAAEYKSTRRGNMKDRGVYLGAYVDKDIHASLLALRKKWLCPNWNVLFLKILTLLASEDEK